MCVESVNLYVLNILIYFVIDVINCYTLQRNNHYGMASYNNLHNQVWVDKSDKWIGNYMIILDKTRKIWKNMYHPVHVII